MRVHHTIISDRSKTVRKPCKGMHSIGSKEVSTHTLRAKIHAQFPCGVACPKSTWHLRGIRLSGTSRHFFSSCPASRQLIDMVGVSPPGPPPCIFCVAPSSTEKNLRRATPQLRVGECVYIDCDHSPIPDHLEYSKTRRVRRVHLTADVAARLCNCVER